MLTLLAVILLLVAAVISRTRHSGWWPALACTGLALLTLAHGVALDLD